MYAGLVYYYDSTTGVSLSIEIDEKRREEKTQRQEIKGHEKIDNVAAQGGTFFAFRLRRPLPDSDSLSVESSIILVASDWDFSLTLSGCPALCVKLSPPSESHNTNQFFLFRLPLLAATEGGVIVLSQVLISAFTCHLSDFP